MSIYCHYRQFSQYSFNYTFLPGFFFYLPCFFLLLTSSFLAFVLLFLCSCIVLSLCLSYLQLWRFVHFTASISMSQQHICTQKPTLDRNPTMYGKVECLSMENYTSTKLNDDIYEFSMTLISFGLSNWPFPFKLLPWKVELTFSRNMSIQHTFWTFQQWPCLE